MNYFSFRPNTYGWATSNVMAMMPFDMHLPEDRSFLGYKSKRHIEELENFVKEFDDNLSISRKGTRGEGRSGWAAKDAPPARPPDDDT